MKLRSQFVRACLVCGMAGVAMLACGRASQESEPASASQSKPTIEQALPQSQPATPSAAEPPVQAESESAVVESEQESVQSAKPRVIAPRPSGDQRSRGAAAPAPKRERATRKDSGKSSAAAAPGDSPAAEATLAYSESPELITALAEFDAQWERLTNTRACDDACRAFDSMRRSAKRICELVVPEDPRQRCRTAQARLDQASRDLAARCSECR